MIDIDNYDPTDNSVKCYELAIRTMREKLEGYFSIFKRGMKGVYQHCSEKHLHRYLAEFDFRYNARLAKGVNDGQRAEKALKGVVGKRLTYRDSSAAQSQGRA